MDSNYFFVNPSFLLGAARALDLGGTIAADSYLVSNTPEEADTRALASDWASVASDLAAAMIHESKAQKEAAVTA
ncbi:MAG: hypothetical protein K2X99_08425 [Gemmatimonadaceae bacterium]|nr:hypothetical protein [Gemmatimonadaceae bacterium]